MVTPYAYCMNVLGRFAEPHLLIALSFTCTSPCPDMPDHTGKVRTFRLSSRLFDKYQATCRQSRDQVCGLSVKMPSSECMCVRVCSCGQAGRQQNVPISSSKPYLRRIFMPHIYVVLCRRQWMQQWTWQRIQTRLPLQALRHGLTTFCGPLLQKVCGRQLACTS